MKLWAGRTGGDVDERLSAINNSIGFDSRIVGGDVCAARLDGFMHGLTPESYGGEVSSSAEIEPSGPETSVPQGK